MISSPAQPAAYKVFLSFSGSQQHRRNKGGYELLIYAPKTNRDNDYWRESVLYKIVVFKNVFRKHCQPVSGGFCEWENGTFYNFLKDHVNLRSLQREVGLI